jgi:hypothetical protein
MAIKQNLYDPNPNPFDKNKIGEGEAPKKFVRDQDDLLNPKIEVEHYNPENQIPILE